MKRHLIAFLLLVAVMAQAQVKTKSEYEIGKIGTILTSKITARVITIDGVAEKFCVFEITPPSNPAVVASITEAELETLLHKIDEIKVGNMDLNSDYFEKSFVTITAMGYIEIGYYIKTKLDATKGQQWFIKIKDGIHEGLSTAPLMDIYKTLGKARAKLQTL